MQRQSKSKHPNEKLDVWGSPWLCGCYHMNGCETKKAMGVEEWARHSEYERNGEKRVEE